MSAKNPNPEERKRMVDAALKSLRPEWLDNKAMTEIQQIMAARNKCREKVIAKLRPIVQSALEAPVVSPFYAHSEQGRAALLETAMKLYVDELRQFNREEALFLLAAIYSELTLGEFI